MKRLSTKKLLTAIGLLVFPFCLSGTAEAGDFVCSRPASYQYNCGNKEWPQSAYCPSEYQRECGNFSQRQRRVNEVKRAVARAPKREEPVDNSEDVVPELPVKKPAVVAKAPKAPAVADKDVVEPVAPNEPVAKAPAKKDEPAKVADKTKQDEEDGLGDGLVPAPDKKKPVASEPAAVATDKTVKAIPARDQAAAKPVNEKIPDGKEVCSESSKEILTGKSPSHPESHMKILRSKMEAILGSKLSEDTKNYRLKPSSGKSCTEDASFLTGNTYQLKCLQGTTEAIKPADIKVEGDRLTVMRGRVVNLGITTIDASGKFALKFCTDGKKVTVHGTAIGNTTPAKITKGKVTLNFKPSAQGGFDFDTVSGANGAVISKGHIAGKPIAEAKREVAAVDEAQ